MKDSLSSSWRGLSWSEPPEGIKGRFKGGKNNVSSEGFEGLKRSSFEGYDSDVELGETCRLVSSIGVFVPSASMRYSSRPPSSAISSGMSKGCPLRAFGEEYSGELSTEKGFDMGTPCIGGVDIIKPAGPLDERRLDCECAREINEEFVEILRDLGCLSDAAGDDPRSENGDHGLSFDDPDRNDCVDLVDRTSLHRVSESKIMSYPDPMNSISSFAGNESTMNLAGGLSVGSSIQQRSTRSHKAAGLLSGGFFGRPPLII